MIEAFFGVTVGVVLVAVALIWWRLERNTLMIKHELEKSIQSVNHSMDSATMPEVPTLEEMREEMQDLIQDTIGSMRTPQIADHLGAVLQQWAQLKMHKEMQAIQKTADLLSDTGLGDHVQDMMP